MQKLWFPYIIYLCLIVGCSDNEGENSTSSSASEAIPFDSFVPEYLATVPQISPVYKEYFKHNFENYVIDGSVDSVNLKQGYWKIQDGKRNLTFQGTYVNDSLSGWWEVLSGNTIICAGNYVQNEKQGYWSYLNIGQIKNSKYVNYRNDTLNGLAREFTLDSVLISDGNYINGLKNGYWKIFFLSGVLKEEGDYRDNVKIGWWKNYDEYGKIQQEASYSKGEISGYVIRYLNGIISEEGQQFYGNGWGVWKYYDANGVLEKIEGFDGN